MIRAVAFCPHPPLLVPEVARGAAHELDDLRAACRAAIQQVAADVDAITVLGSGAGPAFHAPTTRGTLAPYGVELEVPLGSDEPGPVALPLSLTVGAWLLRDALGPNCGASGWSLGDGSVVGCSAGGERTSALLVMGDGSARRSKTAPGYLDERALGFDAGVVAALASGDPDRLRVDGALAADLLAAGAPAWNTTAHWLAGQTFDAELRYDAAPYGVGYFVATWTRRE